MLPLRKRFEYFNSDLQALNSNIFATFFCKFDSDLSTNPEKLRKEFP